MVCAPRGAEWCAPREALSGVRPWCVQCSVLLDGLRGCSQRVSASLAETSFAELHLQLCICLSSSDCLSLLPGAGILVRPELGAGGSGRLRFAATCCFCWTELTGKGDPVVVLRWF